MDQFAQQLRAVTEDPPPSSIDLDRLISSEYRRRRRVQYGFGGGAVAAVTALVLAVPTVFAGGVNAPPGGPPLGAGCRTSDEPGTQQSHSAPRPTEACADAIVRLQGALFEVIEALAPGLVKPDDVTFAYVPTRLAYRSVVNIPAARGGGLVRVEIMASHEYAGQPRTTCPPQLPCDPDAPKVQVSRMGPAYQALSDFKDGTALLVSSTAQVLNSAQVAAIAGCEALTLFPDPNAAVAPNVVGPPQDPTARKLTGQLRPELERLLPTSSFSGPGDTGTGWFAVSRGFGWDAFLEVRDSTGRGSIHVNYLKERPPCTTQPLCETGPECPHVDEDSRCTVEPDGTEVLMLETTADGTVHHLVAIYRTDGTIVQLSASNFVWDEGIMPTGELVKGVPSGMVITRDRPFLTNAQLVELGRQLHH
jgi:hypothetical protein